MYFVALTLFTHSVLQRRMPSALLPHQSFERWLMILNHANVTIKMKRCG
jgi:hypothetical protein